jgi:hypothetical protein
MVGAVALADDVAPRHQLAGVGGEGGERLPVVGGEARHGFELGNEGSLAALGHFGLLGVCGHNPC